MTVRFADSELQLEPYNLYFNGTVTVDSNRIGAVLRRKEVIWDGNINDAIYTVKSGDELDRIANEQYKGIVSQPYRYWWLIADANRELIRNPLDISGLINKEITIPYFQLFKLLRVAQ